jgi:hypothetical protein
VNILQGLRAVALASGFKRGEFIGDTKLSPTFIRCHHHHHIAHEKIGPPHITTYTTRSLLGRNHREIKKNSKTLTTGEPSQQSTAGSGASKPGTGSTVEPEEVMMIEETWMQPCLAYMINKTLPKDTVEARRIIRRSKAFIMLQGKL